MRYLPTIILLISLKCAAQSDATFKVKKSTMSSDTTGAATIAAMIGLPDSIILISCQMVFSSRGEIFKAGYAGTGHEKPPAMISNLVNRAKPKDVLFFDQIFVLKNGQRYWWPDKAYRIY